MKRLDMMILLGLIAACAIGGLLTRPKPAAQPAKSTTASTPATTPVKPGAEQDWQIVRYETGIEFSVPKDFAITNFQSELGDDRAWNAMGNSDETLVVLTRTRFIGGLYRDWDWPDMCGGLLEDFHQLSGPSIATTADGLPFTWALATARMRNRTYVVAIAVYQERSLMMIVATNSNNSGMAERVEKILTTLTQK